MHLSHFQHKPVFNSQSQILILGSFPGKVSIQNQEFYAHPRNQFWQMITDLFDQEKTFLELDHMKRCQFLLDRRIGLWDVLSSCKREGSLDSAIVDPVPNPIEDLLKSSNHLKAIFLNGRKAETLFKKYFSEIPVPSFYLPSTSPANQQLSYFQKIQKWKLILSYLE